MTDTLIKTINYAELKILWHCGGTAGRF